MNHTTHPSPDLEAPIVTVGPEGVIVLPMRHTWSRYNLGFLASLNISPHPAQARQ